MFRTINFPLHPSISQIFLCTLQSPDLKLIFSHLTPGYHWLTLFQAGSGMTLSDRSGPLWPGLIFCYITRQKMALTPKTCFFIKFLIFRHPFTPLFQHSNESIPPFMSINVDQYLHIETLKIRKTPKGLWKGNFFLSLISLKFYVWDSETIRISDFEFLQKKFFFWFFPIFT